ncbi:MAG TPA: MBL fold metallo-hydrolase [Vicinamibacteria bacterium]|nr:MBL fold metallo-hydrolase [Vicinamibacteria bacterium]
MTLRIILPEIAVLSLFLAACGTRQDTRLAKVVPSAVVEEREGPGQAELDAPTQVVVLGTGTPVPDAKRAGFSIAVIHKGETYLFDVGAGSIRNAVIARYKYDIPSLYPSLICCVFVTHLHSDHTADYPELASTLWWRRRHALRAWGPKGLEALTQGMYAMMAPDTALRTSGNQPVRTADAYEIDVTQISEGVVLEKDGMLVEAFSVNHGEVKPAYGYRITTDEKSIVISGDTAYSDKVAEMSRGVDLLFHEVISDEGLSRTSEGFQAYHRVSHTTASELGRLASLARPGLLVLIHGLFYGVPEHRIIDEVRAEYTGRVVLANDLDRY